MNGCRINHVANTITLTKKFLQKASNPASEECAYLQQIRTNFPHLRVTTNPSPKKKSSSRARLSYKQMRNYINCLPDSEKWIEPFEQVMRLAKSQKNPYLYTYEWFSGTFPGYTGMHDAAPMRISRTSTARFVNSRPQEQKKSSLNTSTVTPK